MRRVKQGLVRSGGVVLGLSLVACVPTTVKPGGGAFEAVAQTPQGLYSFSCDPAVQPGTPVTVSQDLALTCPSTDGKAILTLLITTVTFSYSVPAPSPTASLISNKTPASPITRTETRQTANVVLSIPGTPSVTYGGEVRLGSYSFSNLFSASTSGEFSGSLNPGVTLRGRFGLKGS